MADAQNEKLDEYVFDNKKLYHSYWLQGTEYVVVERDDCLDLVLQDKYAKYEDISLQLSSPSINHLDRIRFQAALQSLVSHRINEETMVLLAIQCKKMSPILNMYCARRACDFYQNKRRL